MIVSFTVSSADACTSHAFLLARLLLDVKAAFFLPSATAEEDRTCLIAFVGDDMVVVVVVVVVVVIIFGVRREKS
jgi:hypothetical protein